MHQIRYNRSYTQINQTNKKTSQKKAQHKKQDKYYIYNDNSMQNSRTIKQSITISQQKQSQNTKNQLKIGTPCSSAKQKNMAQFIPSQYEEQKNYGEEEVEEVEEEDNYVVGDGDREEDGGVWRSMFTIREEQSYQYQSEQSRCKMAVKCQSYIDHLSTIKAANQSNHNVDHNVDHNKISSFQPTSQKMQENPTMSTLHYNRMPSEEVISDRVEGWDSKISAKLSGIELFQEEVVEQEDFIVLKQSEKALNLDLSKNHRTTKPFERMIKNVDIAYTCADQDFYQILKLLQKQGIKVIQNPKKQLSRYKQNLMGTATTSRVVNQGSLKKVKLKIMKKQSTKVYERS